MADAPVVHIGENSPEHVAYKLMERVATAERKSLQTSNPTNPDYTPADRKWILDTYAECLKAVRTWK